MQQIIVPLDFSETSFNAAEYAADMFANRNDVTITLYHFYEEEEDLEPATELMKSMIKQLESKYVYFESLIETGDNFVDSLAEFAEKKDAQYIIMGLTGKTPLE